MVRALKQRLTAATIIPPDLYVERAADAQLTSIVEDMGRPGYVLVARQMGKTNLLINMKRDREAKGEAVVYVDLSKRFVDFRDCLRNIVDIAADTVPALADAISDIQGVRCLELPPATEYERSLIAFLRKRQMPRLVIVLDEVDSLTPARYSDSVFALVRSMYFSRINYPELERLTYVLSGVADPIDLIKDKSISPFNIGEKIFLSDFSREQFRTFLKKADLQLSADVAARVYHWVRGNPRMSWDICSALEDMVGTVAVKPGDVDRLVKALYLDRFDIPPVDHIRELVASDPLLAEAVMTLRHGDSESLSAKTKSRLYLAGITDASDLKPRVKNPVIDSALSQSWLVAVQQEKDDPLTVAAAHFESGRYAQAVVILDEYRQKHQAEPLPGKTLFTLGSALYNLGNFGRAVETLRAAYDLFAPPDRGAVAFLLGSGFLHLKEPEAARPYLEDTASRSGPHQSAARVLLATSYLEDDPERYERQILELTSAVVSEAESGQTERMANSETLAGAFYNLAWIHRIKGRTAESLRAIDNAIDVAPAHQMLEPMIFKAKIISNAGDRVKLLSLAVDRLIDDRITASPRFFSSLAATHRGLGELALLLMRDSLDDVLDRLLEYLANTQAEIHGKFQVLLQLFRAMDDVGQGERSLRLVRRAVQRYMSPVPPIGDRIAAFRWLSKYEGDDRRAAAFETYLGEVEHGMQQEHFEEDDFNVLVSQMNSLIAAHRYDKALRVVAMMSRISEWSEQYGVVFSALSLFYTMTVYSRRGEPEMARLSARSLIEYTSARSQGKLAADQLNMLRQMRSEALRVSRSSVEQFAGLRRNDRIRVKEVASGRVIETKFKFVERSLRDGILVLEAVLQPDKPRRKG